MLCLFVNNSFAQFYRCRAFRSFCVLDKSRQFSFGWPLWTCFIEIALSHLVPTNQTTSGKVSRDRNKRTNEIMLARPTYNNRDHEWFTLKTYIKYKLGNAAFLVPVIVTAVIMALFAQNYIRRQHNRSQKQWIQYIERTTDFALFDWINICIGFCCFATKPAQHIRGDQKERERNRYEIQSKSIV